MISGVNLMVGIVYYVVFKYEYVVVVNDLFKVYFSFIFMVMELVIFIL